MHSTRLTAEANLIISNKIITHVHKERVVPQVKDCVFITGRFFYKRTDSVQLEKKWHRTGFLMIF